MAGYKTTEYWAGPGMSNLQIAWLVRYFRVWEEEEVNKLQNSLYYIKRCGTISWIMFPTGSTDCPTWWRWSFLLVLGYLRLREDRTSFFQLYWGVTDQENCNIFREYRVIIYTNVHWERVPLIDFINTFINLSIYSLPFVSTFFVENIYVLLKLCEFQ